ncbi:VCBS domain-containing protein [Bradyrhizobium diazoefficiens]|uniref:VCBS domain-containing protein n=1 Tax=Bradyrhizobium diazoefficiens TaxID=1355477 RepID=UPI00272BC222|nr:VCBS domain-containing protein [Bradyrhizobium diazoefficiens]WLA64942.1 VCBS domain-containing protein [Bradyrhizobium diazoefficiens]
MTLSLAATYAALAEEVYQRGVEPDANDIPLTLDKIFPGTDPATLFVSLDEATLEARGLISGPNGMIYSSKQTGFAAQVLFVNGRYVVAFRGTDWGNGIDGGDFQANTSLGRGTATGGQFADMVNLMKLVTDLPNATGNVTVTGQSLGGGLAILAGSIYGVETYAYDPAPFAAELRTSASIRAAQSLGFTDVIANEVYGKSVYEQRTALLQSGKLTQVQIGQFIAAEDAEYAAYVQNISILAGNVHAYRVDHEVLASNAKLLAAFGGIPFDTLTIVNVSKAGQGDGSIADGFALHHPALMALLLKDPSFGDLTQSDGGLRYALWDNGQIIAGPPDHARADPAELTDLAGNPVKITSAVDGGSPQTGPLYRALWLDDDFRAQFELAFRDIQHGAARSGWDNDNGFWSPRSIHQALIELGLRVVRDGIHSPSGSNGSVASPAAHYVFGPIHNGEDVAQSDDNYAIIRMEDINVRSQEDGTQIDQDRTMVDNAFAATLDSSYRFLNNWSAATPFTAPTYPWEVLVVQDGGDGLSMHYSPTTEVADKSHMIFGGSGADGIRGSSETDYISGGGGDDIFFLGNEAGGGGKGDFIEGGAGRDTLDYSMSTSPINLGAYIWTRYPGEESQVVKDNYIVSNELDGYRHDVATNIENVIGPADPSFVNYFRMGAALNYDHITLLGGTNYIFGVDEGDVVDGQGGFNIVGLGLPSNYYKITPTAYGWQVARNHKPGVIDPYVLELRGVQAIYFEATPDTVPTGTPWVLNHFGENNNNGSLYAYADQASSPTSYTFYDSNSDKHTLTVEYYGTALQHGTLTATIAKETSTTFTPNADRTGVTPVHNPGKISLNYTPPADAKYVGNDFFTVTIGEVDNPYKTTIFVYEDAGGTLYQVTATMGAGAAGATLAEPLQPDATGRASVSGAISITDSYVGDVETASSVFVPSSTSRAPMGQFTAQVQLDAAGHQYVAWSYVMDDGAFLTIDEGSNAQETYRVWLTDQFGMKSAPKDVVVTIAAKPSATTQIVSADTDGVVVQGQDPNGFQIVSGKIHLSDTDLKEMHAVSYKQIGGSADQGMFFAALTGDTTGSGAGELTWQYVIQNSKIFAEGNGTHTFDIAITDGRGGIVHQAVAITDYAFNPNAAPSLLSPATLMAQSGTTATEGGSFMDANFAAHHSVSVTSLDGNGFDWGQLTATLVQDSAWPTPGMGSYTLTYVPDQAALDALQDGETHVEHWQVSLAGDNGKSDSKTVTVVVGRPPNQTAIDPSASTTSGLLVADTHQTSTETASGSVSFVDSMTSDVHVLSATFLSSDGGSSPIGSFTAALTADTTGGAGAGRADWTYEAANSDLEAIPSGQVVKEIWQLALGDGHGGTTLQNVTIYLSQTPPNTAPVVTTTAADVFAHLSESAATTGSAAHDEVSGVIAFADADVGDAPIGAVSSITAVYLDASGHQVALTTAQQTMIAAAFSIAPDAANGQTGTVAWTFSASDADLDFLSRGEKIQIVAVVTVDDLHGHTVDTPVAITVRGANDAPAAVTIDGGSISETAAPLAIDLLQGASDPDRNDALHISSVSSVTSSDGHAISFDLSGNQIVLDPSQFAYLGRSDQTTVTVHFSVSDGQLPSPGTATLVVTGTNEAPQVAAASEVALDQTAGPTEVNLLSLTTDVDTSDVLSLAPNSVTAVSSDGHAVLFTQSTTGLQLDPTQFSYLADGEKIVLTVNYTVTDGLASTTGQQTIAVYGKEDLPVVAPIAAGTVSERAAVQYINLLQDATDPDGGTTLSVMPQSISISSSDGHPADWTIAGNVLALDPADFRYLNDGESVTVTINYTVTDGVAGVRNSASLTVTGTNSMPTVTPVDAGTVSQNGPIVVIDLLSSGRPGRRRDAVCAFRTGNQRFRWPHSKLLHEMGHGVRECRNQSSPVRLPEKRTVGRGHDQL